MRTKQPVLVDIETDGRSPHEGELLLIGWCLVGDPVQVWQVPFEPCPEGLREMLADPDRPIVEMTKYDARYLRLQGWEVAGPIYDIQVMAWVLNENQPLSLDLLVARYLHRKMDKRLRRSKGVVYFKTDAGREVPLTVIKDDPSAWPQFVAYCFRDVDAEGDLFQTLWEKLEDTTWLEYFLEEEVPFTSELLGMECAGLPVNLTDSENLREELEVLHTRLAAELLEEGGLPPSFNIGSGDQLETYLYYPVAELGDSLELGTEACEALKSCQSGEHDDCGVFEEFFDDGQASGHYGEALHVTDLLPRGFELRSVGRTQVHGVWTFRGRNLPPTEKTPSEKRWATSTPVLKSNYQAAVDPWCLKLFEYRRIDKALTTYLRKYPLLAHGGGEPETPGGRNEGAALPRLYGRFNQTGTKTGRLSSSEPNLQNQPSHGELGARMRALFQGDLIVGDYSQLEPRLMAHFSEDPRLMAVYREGRDSYIDLGEAVFGKSVEKEDDERGIAKTLLLAMGYGAYEKKVAQILTINGYPTDVPTAKGYLDELQRYYSRFFAWREHVIRKVKVQGYVQTIGGRHRRLKAAFVDRKNWKNVGYGERQAVNAVVQGSAGDIVRRAMGAWQSYEKCLSHIKMLAQVHDEVVFEYEREHFTDHDGWPDYYLGLLKSAFEDGHGYTLRVPLLFEPHEGDSWFSAKEGGIELPEDLLEEETTGYEEEAS